MTTSFKQALVLYTVLARDVEDFIDMVEECEDVTALELLYHALTYPNPKHDTKTVEINLMGSNIVKRKLKKKSYERNYGW